MTEVQTQVRGVQQEFVTECYDCAGEIKIRRGILIGEFWDCPDCGVELELRQYDPTMEEKHGPIIPVRYNDNGVVRSNYLLTLAQSPDEEEDWGE